MILPNKDVPFEQSLLKKSLDVMQSIKEGQLIEELFLNNSELPIEDLEVILLFLYSIGRVEIDKNGVVKVDKKGI